MVTSEHLPTFWLTLGVTKKEKKGSLHWGMSGSPVGRNALGFMLAKALYCVCFTFLLITFYFVRIRYGCTFLNTNPTFQIYDMRRLSFLFWLPSSTFPDTIQHEAFLVMVPGSNTHCQLKEGWTRLPPYSHLRRSLSAIHACCILACMTHHPRCVGPRLMVRVPTTSLGGGVTVPGVVSIAEHLEYHLLQAAGMH